MADTSHLARPWCRWIASPPRVSFRPRECRAWSFRHDARIRVDYLSDAPVYIEAQFHRRWCNVLVNFFCKQVHIENVNKKSLNDSQVSIEVTRIPSHRWGGVGSGPQFCAEGRVHRHPCAYCTPESGGHHSHSCVWCPWDAVDEYVRIGESIVHKDFKHFCKAVITTFEAVYLRAHHRRPSTSPSHSWELWLSRYARQHWLHALGVVQLPYHLERYVHWQGQAPFHDPRGSGLIRPLDMALHTLACPGATMTSMFHTILLFSLGLLA